MQERFSGREFKTVSVSPNLLPYYDTNVKVEEGGLIFITDPTWQRIIHHLLHIPYDKWCDYDLLTVSDSPGRAGQAHGE